MEQKYFTIKEHTQETEGLFVVGYSCKYIHPSVRMNPYQTTSQSVTININCRQARRRDREGLALKERE
jgi:hypothetical protein